MGGTSIQALGLDCANTQVANITDGTPQSLSIPANTQMFELASIIPLYINFEGTAGVTTHVFPAGVGVYKVLSGQTTVSVTRIIATDTGPVSLTPLA